MSRILEQYTSAGGVGVNAVKKMAEVRRCCWACWVGLAALLGCSCNQPAMPRNARLALDSLSDPPTILTLCCRWDSAPRSGWQSHVPVVRFISFPPLPFCADGGPVHQGVAGNHGGRACLS